MDDRKLYEVEVRFTYYAEASSPGEAEEFALDAWGDGRADRVLVREVTRADHRLASGWTPDCLVYGTDDDVELGVILAHLPTRAGGAS